jgi:hypothetical protein
MFARNVSVNLRSNTLTEFTKTLESENWSLASLQQRLVNTGGRLVKHARYYWLLLAEGHLTRRRFGTMLGRITLLPVPTG